MSDHYDIMIVGAGPAGCRAAVLALEMNPDWKVLLIEGKEGADWERYHSICAEGVSATGLKELKDVPQARMLNHLSSVRELWPSGILIESEVEGFIVDRRGIMRDQIRSFQEKGGELDRCNVIDVRTTGDDCRVLTHDKRILGARYLIGADGAGSIVRRRVFRSETETVVAVTQYLTKEGGVPGTMLLEYGAKYKGKYRWDNYKVGFPTGSGNVPADVVQPGGRGIPIGMVNSLVNGNTALIGDAGGLANPVTYAGLRNSWTSARMAVEAMTKGDLAGYEVEWRRSPLADPSFIEAHRLLRGYDDEALARLASHLKYGANMTAIIVGLMKTPGFSTFYRAHVRKLSYGW
jgi:digeranylgeranylglycerophospholipid reductase